MTQISNSISFPCTFTSIQEVRKTKQCIGFTVAAQPVMLLIDAFAIFRTFEILLFEPNFVMFKSGVCLSPFLMAFSDKVKDRKLMHFNEETELAVICAIKT